MIFTIRDQNVSFGVDGDAFQAFEFAFALQQTFFSYKSRMQCFWLT